MSGQRRRKAYRCEPTLEAKIHIDPSLFCDVLHNHTASGPTEALGSFLCALTHRPEGLCYDVLFEQDGDGTGGRMIDPYRVRDLESGASWVQVQGSELDESQVSTDRAQHSCSDSYAVDRHGNHRHACDSGETAWVDSGSWFSAASGVGSRPQRDTDGNRGGRPEDRL